MNRESLTSCLFLLAGFLPGCSSSDEPVVLESDRITVNPVLTSELETHTLSHGSHVLG